LRARAPPSRGLRAFELPGSRLRSGLVAERAARRRQVRVLVKRDELTLEGIKQFFVAVER
jgi:hypothetical protein